MFKAWPKIVRVENRRVPIFTEKLDGTNACIFIDDNYETFHCQSRNRIIAPGNDNFGFAAWVHANIGELIKLGPGYHFGEWWGQGIGRGYDLDRKVFSAFYPSRAAFDNPCPDLVDVVPILPVSSIEEAREYLTKEGSIAAKKYGVTYNRPEGAILYEQDTHTNFKIIMDK